MDQNLTFDARIFNTFKVMALSVKFSHMFVQGSHMFAMFPTHVLHGKRRIPLTHVHITLTTFTRFAQNRSVVSMLALYHIAGNIGGN